jgi:cyanate lyase
MKKIVKENLNQNLSLSNDEKELLYKKLEFTFKKSNNYIINKLINKEDLTDDDLRLILRKLEYTFRKKGNILIDKIKTYVGIEELPNIKYSLLKFKKDK